MPFDIGPHKKISSESVLLLRAAEVIQHPSRWNIGKADSGRLWWKRYCAVGALYRTIELYDLSGGSVYSRKLHVRRYLDKAAQSHGFTCMAALNDHPNTTHELVLTVFREAAELAMTD